MNNKTLSDLKERMAKLEGMFSRILDSVDKIGSDVKHIKENQDSLSSRHSVSST